MSQTATLPSPPVRYRAASPPVEPVGAARRPRRPPHSPASTRLVSLDAYRGFVMLLMASEGLGIAKYVHDTGAGGIWPFLAHQTQHVEWAGCSLRDLIQPSFTFIVGVALPFSLASRRAQGQSFGWLLAARDRRSLILICLGDLPALDRQAGRPTSRSRTRSRRSAWATRSLFLLGLGPPRVAGGRGRARSSSATGSRSPSTRCRRPASTTRRSACPPSWPHHGCTGFAAHWDKNTNFAAGVRRLVPQPVPARQALRLQRRRLR